MGWWYHGTGLGLGGWEMTLLSALMMLLVWGGLFALIYFAVRAGLGGSQRRDRAEEPTDRALQILTERFARGEIDAEQFQEMKRELR